MASLDIPILPSSDVLTPNTRSEAEAAFEFNALSQTASAGKPQPTTPPASVASAADTGYMTAAGGRIEPPYPTEATAERVKGSLSRGYTSAVLEKMAGAGSPEETLLSKRASREGRRRTESIDVGVGAGAGPGAARPDLHARVQSYSKEDLKRVMSERLMQGERPREGYSSATATPPNENARPE